MALTSITEVFSGATVSSFNITIPSGSLASCANPSSGNPNEIILGVLENMHRAVSSGTPTYITTSATTALVNATTYRKTYVFSVDMEFNSNNLLESLDVKAEPS